MARVELRGVSRVFPGGIEALGGVDLDVADGEYVAVVGPSGSGKSTLLRLIAGLEPLDGGSILIDGRHADTLPPADRDVAMVFQDQVPYPHLSVFDNLAFGLRARGRPAAEVKARVEEVAGLLGLADVLGRSPRALSGGQRRRVALGRALARRPAILLLDEPLSALDAPLRAATRADLIELHRRLGTTTLHVTHDQAEAMALGDRVALIDRGRLVQVGTPTALYDRPATRFVAGFLGSPPMNLLRGTLRTSAEGIQLKLDGVDASATLPEGSAPIGRDDGPIELGMRPERIALGEGGGLSVRGVVRRLESLGHETLATLDVGPHAVGVRLPPHPGVRPGDSVPIRFDMDGAHWFDPRTGAALLNGREGASPAGPAAS